jgi:predicted TIM-barrel fold metal-dependent hydrolase
MSDELNQGMVKLVREINERYGECRITGLATVFPGEPDQVAILERAFDAGLKGVKLHSHVQCVAADDPVLDDVYKVCSQRGMPILFHTGREPNSHDLKINTETVCDIMRIRRVLERYPQLKLVVPHMGNNETREYIALLDDFPNLCLDTTLGVSNFFPSWLPGGYDTATLRTWLINYADRILYGTDWPNIPHEWCTELWSLLDMKLPDMVLRKILGSNAMRVYGIELLPKKNTLNISLLRPDITIAL